MHNSDSGEIRIGRLVLAIFMCCVASILAACSKPQDYRTFMSQTPAYYRTIANACDGLLSQCRSNQAPSVFKGNDRSLPECLLDLHSTKIEVHSLRLDGTNAIPPYVWIMVGVSRPGYGITWEKNDYGEGKVQWELSANADGRRTILYSHPQ